MRRQTPPAPSAPPRPLGDTHNFGRRVELRGDRVFKPRALLWEWLLLGANSPLRARLDALAAERLAPGAFAFLPRLRFYQPRSLEREGEVERLSLRPLGRLAAEERGALGRVVGRALALFSWLGLADLHWENLALGRDARGEIIFAPLDVEMILSDLASPTETKLLPDADPEYAAMCRHAAGVRRALPFLGKPVPGELVAAIGEGYIEALEALEGDGAALAQVLASQPALRRAPIRVCLRGTVDYQLPPERAAPPYLPEELVQLERGDVPYFFHRYGSPGLRYFLDAERRREGLVRLAPGQPKTNPVLRLSQRLRGPSRAALRDQGLFLVLAAFDSPALRGPYRAGELELRLTSRRIVVRRRGETLDARRDLSAFVASVYLPCACGEDRSPLAAPPRPCDGVGPR